MIPASARAGRISVSTRGGRIAVLIFALALVAVVFWGMASNRPLEVEYSKEWTFTLTGSDNIGGKYNASIDHYNVTRFNETFGRDEISFRYNGSTERGPFIPTANNTMAWLKNNTTGGSIILCWWPYGHMIRGIAEREPVIWAPSSQIADTVVFPERVVRWEKSENVKEVAVAFLATDPNVTKEIMNKYLAYYVLVEKDSITYVDALCQAAGLDPKDYTIYESGTGMRFTGAGQDCAMRLFVSGANVPGFEKAYEDDVFLVYKLAG